MKTEVPKKWAAKILGVDQVQEAGERYWSISQTDAVAAICAKLARKRRIRGKK